MFDPASLGPLLLFSIGLLGGAHCVGMCGPLVMIYSKNMKSRRFAFVARQHVLLNLGRVTIYMVLGAVSGFAGTILEAFPIWGQFNAYQFNAYVGVAIGALIVLLGTKYVVPELLYFVWSSLIRGHLNIPGAGLSNPVMGLMIKFKDFTRSPKIYLLGFLHGFLPCPIIVPPLLYVLSIGSVMDGVAIMGLIGLGTFGTMFFLGISHNILPLSRRVWMMRVLGVLLIILGLIPLLSGLKTLGYIDWMIHIEVYQPFA